MGLSALYSADGSALKDADGNQLYVVTPTPDPGRMVSVRRENRRVIVPRENRRVAVRGS